MTDSWLEHLQRRAYASDDLDAQAARLQLAELAAAALREEQEAEPPRCELSAPPRAPRPLLRWLAVCASLAVVAATAIVTGPKSSLVVFDRPATAIDAAMQERVPQWHPRSRPRPQMQGIDAYWDVDPVAGSARWLGASEGYDVFGYLGEGVGPVSGSVVCLSISQSRAVLVIWCVTEAEFARSGIHEHRQSRPTESPVHITVLWGPTGDARIVDAPPAVGAPQ